MKRIVPHLWFDKEAKEAAAFYTSLFPNSKVTNTTTITGTPSGDCDIVTFEMQGQRFMAISAGPYFKFTPAISLMVNFDPSQDPDAAKRIDEVWAKLSEEGKVMMEIGEYPFSKHYGWVADKYGLSWQLILTNPEGLPAATHAAQAGEERPTIIPSLMFTGAKAGYAQEATDFYLSVFKNSPSNPSGQGKRGTLATRPADMGPDKKGTVLFTDYMLEGQWFAAMDSAHEHGFDFNEAISFIVNCDTQEEIDYYWEKLSAVPASEQCGWLKDKFGVSWQIVPTAMEKMMTTKDKATLDRVTKAFLKMKKFDITELQKAFDGQ